MDYPQPPRGPQDGAITIKRVEGSDPLEFTLHITHNDQEVVSTLSAYNLWRLLGLLSVFLDVRLQTGVAIQLGHKLWHRYVHADGSSSEHTFEKGGK
jgi:hypothetical protein